jgi:hypothetical protein
MIASDCATRSTLRVGCCEGLGCPFRAERGRNLEIGKGAHLRGQLYRATRQAIVLSGDQSIPFQHNLSKRKISVSRTSCSSNAGRLASLVSRTLQVLKDIGPGK